MLLQALSEKIVPKSAAKASHLMLANSTVKGRAQYSGNCENSDSSTSAEYTQSSNSTFASMDISACTPKEKEQQKFPIKETRRLIALSHEMLEILNVLDPGHSVNKGRVLKELIVPILKLSQYEWGIGEIDEIEFKARKLHCSKLTKDLLKCYKYESM